MASQHRLRLRLSRRCPTTVVLSVPKVTVGSVVGLVFLTKIEVWFDHAPDIRCLAKLTSWNNGPRKLQGRLPQF